jgi:hypothetical protein
MWFYKGEKKKEKALHSPMSAREKGKEERLG